MRSGEEQAVGGTVAMIPLYLLATAASLLLVALIRTELRKAQLARMTWDELVAGLGPVKTEAITLAALECKETQQTKPAIDPGELWMMIGEWQGLKQMSSNARLLIALAAHAESWDSQGSVQVADQMRADALAVRRAALWIRVERSCGLGRERAAAYVHEAASRYYLMTERLLELYETSPSRRYTRLTAAVWPYRLTS